MLNITITSSVFCGQQPFAQNKNLNNEIIISGLISQTNIVEHLWISVLQPLKLLVRNRQGVNDTCLLNLIRNYPQTQVNRKLKL